MTKKKSSKPNKQEKRLIWVIIALLAVVVISCISLAFINTSRNSSNNNAVQYETFKSINSDEVFSLLDDSENENTLYVGRETCPHCSTFAPKLIEAIKQENVLVYYYDTSVARADNVDKLNELMEILNVKSVPALLKIKNGTVEMRLSDYKNLDAIVDFIKQ